jgi:cytochrome c peroxidase
VQNSYSDKPASDEFLSKDSAKVALGKLIFFDKRLSIDTSISCASCHNPSLAFTDGNKVAHGVKGRLSRRNTPTLFNIGEHSSFMMDRAALTLEKQILIPINDSNEMQMSMDEVVDRLKSDKKINKLSKIAFGSALNAFVISRSVAAFERTLVSPKTSFDSFMEKKEDLYYPSDARRGYILFTSKRLQCSKCHSLPFFSDFNHYDLGIEQSSSSPDLGLYGATLKMNDKFRFKTPTLRQLKKTAPYFHNGEAPSIEDVIEYKMSKKSKTRDYNPVKLTKDEKKYIISFLKTL